MISFSLFKTFISSFVAIISFSLLNNVFPAIFNFSDTKNVDRNININVLNSIKVFLFSTKAMLEKLTYSSISFL